MMKYTTEDLIKYLYKETTADEAQAIEIALQADWNLRDEYNALRDSMLQLDSVVKSPRQQSVMAILDYARSSAEVAES